MNVLAIRFVELRFVVDIIRFFFLWLLSSNYIFCSDWLSTRLSVYYNKLVLYFLFLIFTGESLIIDDHSAMTTTPKNHYLCCIRTLSLLFTLKFYAVSGDYSTSIHHPSPRLHTCSLSFFFFTLVFLFRLWHTPAETDCVCELEKGGTMIIMGYFIGYFIGWIGVQRGREFCHTRTGRDTQIVKCIGGITWKYGSGKEMCNCKRHGPEILDSFRW